MSVDKLEERTLYNPEKKFKFLREHYDSDDTRNSVASFFQRCSNCEYRERTDLSQFNITQFIKLFNKNIKVSNLHTLATYISYISGYQEWSSFKHKEIIKFHISKMTKDDRSSLLQKIHYITKQDLYNILDDPYYDPRGKAIIFLLFEGVNGTKHDEIINLKISQVENNCINIPGEFNRRIEVPKRLISLLHQVNNLQEIDNSERKQSEPNKKSRNRKVILKDNGNIIKSSFDEPVKVNYIQTLAKAIIRHYFGSDINLAVSIVETSGKVDYLSRIKHELGANSNIERSIFEKLCYRYGINKAYWFKMSHLPILDNIDGYYYNDSEHTEILNSIFQSTPINFTNNVGDKKDQSHNSAKDDFDSNENDEKTQTPSFIDTRLKLGTFGEKIA